MAKTVAKVIVSLLLLTVAVLLGAAILTSHQSRNTVSRVQPPAPGPQQQPANQPQNNPQQPNPQPPSLPQQPANQPQNEPPNPQQPQNNNPPSVPTLSGLKLALPKDPATNPQGYDPKDKCAICTSKLKTDRPVVGANVGECRHFYHDECIKDWISSHDTCPQCLAKMK